MDASAYLRNQGWRGDGHSLDHTGRGIKKALRVSKKVDVLGIGLNKHSGVSDQWWLRAFDEGLKSIGTGKQTTLGQVQKHGVKRGDLYGRFVKGESNPGSIGQSLLPTPEGSDGTITPKITELIQDRGDSSTDANKKVHRKNKGAKRSMEDRARQGTEKREQQMKSLTPKKLAKYQKRAEKKGVKLEEYVNHRAARKAKKHLGKPG